jgi:hypothetical protein
VARAELCWCLSARLTDPQMTALSHILSEMAIGHGLSALTIHRGSITRVLIQGKNASSFREILEENHGQILVAIAKAVKAAGHDEGRPSLNDACRPCRC